MSELRNGILGIIASFLSMIGGMIIIMAYYNLPELKTFGNKMIMYVGISNLIYSVQSLIEFVFDLLNSYENGKLQYLCIIQGFISTYTSQCILLWITILSITIHDTVKNKIVDMTKREIIFICVGFIIPLLLSSIPLLTNSYGKEDGICWVTSNFSNVAQQIQVWGLIYGPLWFFIIFNFSLIIRTLRMLKNLEIDDTDTYFVIRRFLFYPFLWIICWGVGTVNRFFILYGNESSELLITISEELICCQGFFTMIIFVSDKRIYEALIEKYFSGKKKSIITQDEEDQLKQKLKEPSYSNVFEDEENDDYFGHSKEKKNQDPKSVLNPNNTSDCSGENSTLIWQAISPPQGSKVKNDFEQIQSQNMSIKKESTSTHSGILENNSSFKDQKSHHIISKENEQPQEVQRQWKEDEEDPENTSLSLQTKKKKGEKFLKNQLKNNGEWNRMDIIEEDSDEDEFDKEMVQKNINNPEQLFLTKSDAKVLFKYSKMSNQNRNE